jgi:hypothetical protein
MPWLKVGDESSDYPKLMEVAGLEGADGRSVNEVRGWLDACAAWSAKHLTDYVVDLGTALMYGHGNGPQVIDFAVAVNLVEWIQVDGVRKLRIVEDDDFINIRLKADVEHDRQQNNETRDHNLKGPVLLRDGDNCRWCGKGVHWPGRPTKYKGTLDHLHPGSTEEATPDTLVVSCMSCNSSRQADDTGSWDSWHKLLPVPDHPHYGTWSTKYLTDRGLLPAEASERTTPAGPTNAPDTPQRDALAGGDGDPGGAVPVESRGASAGIPAEVDPGTPDQGASAGSSAGGPGVADSGRVGIESPVRASANGDLPGREGTGRVRSGRDGSGGGGSGPQASPPGRKRKKKRRRR